MVETHERDPATEEGWLVIDAAVRSAGRALGDTLISAYAIGSLAHGGFEAASSDVDLALLTSEDAGDVPVEQIRTEVERELPGPMSGRLSVFHASWANFASPPPGSRFPSVDRLDLMRSGILVFGEDLRDRHGVEPAAHEVLEAPVAGRGGPLVAEHGGDPRPGDGARRIAVGGRPALCRDLLQAHPDPRPSTRRSDRRPRRGVRGRLRYVPGMNPPRIGWPP